MSFYPERALALKPIFLSVISFNFLCILRCSWVGTITRISQMRKVSPGRAQCLRTELGPDQFPVCLWSAYVHVPVCVHTHGHVVCVFRVSTHDCVCM